MIRKIGVTGAAGFIGGHLADYIDAQPGFEAVRIVREHFEERHLSSVVAGCEAIVHLAGVSRSDEPQQLYRINMELLEHLILAVRFAGVKPRILFGSTTHEAKQTKYHASKRDGRDRLDRAARELGFENVGVLMPNVFGPGGKPHYNSVVATFCADSRQGRRLTVHSDAGRVKLIYIDGLVRRLFELAAGDFPGNPVEIAPEFDVEVAGIAARVTGFAAGKRPEPEDRFGVLLYRTWLSYPEKEC